MKSRSERLRELIQRDPSKFFWPAVVEVLIELGWKPPLPTDKALEQILDDMSNKGVRYVPENATLTLSPVQTQVLYLMSKGYNRREAGTVLGTSEETVKTHVTKASRRLGAINTTHAVAIALREGLIE